MPDHIDIRFLDENLVAYGVKHIGNKLWVSAKPYLYDIAKGNVTDHVPVYRFGHNDTVGTAWESIYHGSDLRTYLAAAERLQVTSGDAADDGDPVGNGARTVTITGFDGNYDAATETVTMNGEANVLTDTAFLRVCNIEVVTAGVTGWNEGAITISNNADSVVLDVMPIQENMSHSACLTVPDGYTATITQFTMSEASGKGSEVSVWTHAEDGLWIKRQSVLMLDDVTTIPLSMPLVFTERTDIEVRAKAILAGANVAVGFEGWIEAN